MRLHRSPPWAAHRLDNLDDRELPEPRLTQAGDQTDLDRIRADAVTSPLYHKIASPIVSSRGSALYSKIPLYFPNGRITRPQVGRNKMARSTLRCGALTLGCVLAFAFASTAVAQLLNHKDLSASMAITIAQTAIETCKANGYAVSATVVGRNGEIIVQVRGDNTGPHTMENSMRKAYTARTFRSPSGALVERLKADPTLGLIHLTNVIANQGALPIKVGDEVIGAAGASGAPGGEKDEACVKAGIDKVADQLK
jgi:uncharacterized protein GlcG (DUF336 family)